MNTNILSLSPRPDFSQARPNQPQPGLLSVSRTRKEESGDSRYMQVSVCKWNALNAESQEDNIQ